MYLPRGGGICALEPPRGRRAEEGAREAAWATVVGRQSGTHPALGFRPVSDPRTHHYVPQAYLHGFSDPAGQIAVRWRMVDRPTFVSHVRNVASERDFYSFVMTARARLTIDAREKRCQKPGAPLHSFQTPSPKLIWYTRETPRES